MNIKIKHAPLKGEVSIPPSKSYTQRALAASLMHQGKSTLYNIGSSDDELVALEIIKKLGAKITADKQCLVINGDGKIKGNVEINCGESGLAARLFIPLSCLASTPILINAKESLRQRPLNAFIKPLQHLGINIAQKNFNLPISLCGPLQPKDIKIDTSISSQFLSGILFALSYSNATSPIHVFTQNLVSKPYIDMSIEVLNHWGVSIAHDTYQKFIIYPTKNDDKPTIKYTIEGDWSSAAFWIAAASLEGEITLKGLNKNSTQADRKVVDIVIMAGAQAKWIGNDLNIKHNYLNAFCCDLSDCPDLFPILAILASKCHGKSCLIGLNRLEHKESNRADEIKKLLQLLDVEIESDQNTLWVIGKKEHHAINYICPNDHRMAMAAALSCMNNYNTSIIKNASCTKKSYPNFWIELNKLVPLTFLP